MKNQAVIIVSVITLFLSSCLVTSLHRFFTPEDKIFKPELIGNWIDSDEGIWVIRENTYLKNQNGPRVSDSTYTIKYYEEENSISYLSGTLFMLNGKTYVDFFPDPDEDHFTADMSNYHHIPVHTLARFHSNKDSLMFFWFGEEWLSDLFEENRIRIDHEIVDNGQYDSNLLTAETEDLQKFIKKYMDNKIIEDEIEKAFTLDEEADGHAYLKLYPYDGEIPCNE